MNTNFETMITTSIPVWAWNGWNSQWVTGSLTREAVAARVDELKQRDDFESATVIEDGEHLTFVVVNSREFYGQRVKTEFVTTRRGEILTDEEDNLQGDWTPADSEVTNVHD